MFLFNRSNSRVFKDEYKNRIKKFVEENDINANNLLNEGIYEWNEQKVENFKKLLNSYDSIESSEFEIFNQQWKIRIYFYGKFKNDNDYFKFCLINISKKNINISTKFIPYFKISNSDDIVNYPAAASLLYNFNNNACYEYKIYNKDFKNFIDNIDDSQLCIGVYIRFYNIIDNYIKNTLIINEIQDNNYKKENDIYFEWAIKDWKNIKKLRYFESPLFIRPSLLKKAKFILSVTVFL